jgi:outer membrane protein assembly factor BamB
LATACLIQAADHPQFGQAWSRNMVSDEKHLPEIFDPATKRNVRWVAELGTESHSTPVIAGGRIFIGTNNGEPRDPKHEGDRGVFMCLEEATGKLLWQLVAPKLHEDPYYDWPRAGMSSPAVVEADRVYLVNNRYEVLCLDVKGMANGNDGPVQDEGVRMTTRTNAPPQPLVAGPLDADIIWSYDMFASAGIWPHDGAHAVPLIRGNHLYLNTSTGVDNTHKKIRTPDAPSLIVLDKKTGRLLARDREKIAPNIFHSTWSAPSLGKIGGREVIFFLGGNGIVYGFEPFDGAFSEDVASLKKIFEFDPDPEAPKTEIHRFSQNRREGPINFYGMPVVVGDSLYIAGGGDIFWGKNDAWMKRLDLSWHGQKLESKLAWTYPLGRHVMGTPSVADGLVYITDVNKEIHCVDAATGQNVWTHEAKSEFWASTLVADEKVYTGTRRGDFYILAAGREKKLLHTVELGDPISATPVAANGVLYVGTMKKLFALKRGHDPATAE